MAKLKPAIAVLVHTFPLYSLTFIANEVRELRRRGTRVALFAVRRPPPHGFPENMRVLHEDTRYLLPLSAGRAAARHARVLLRRPGPYARALLGALFWGRLSARDRLRSLIHFAEAVCLLEDLEAAGISHLHAHFLSGAASIALFLNVLAGLDYSLTGHGSDMFVERVLIKEKVARAAFTRVTTEFNRRHLLALCDGTAPVIHVVPYGVDLDRFAARGPRPEKRSGPVVALNVGRLVWQKAQHLLLRACAALRREGFDLRIAIIGEGEERAALERLRDESGLGDAVELRGAQSEEQVAEACGTADLFVLCSVSEGFAVVLVEAMASGLPIVAPALHGIPEIISDGVDGVLFPAGSAEGLTAALRPLLVDHEQRARLGEAARRRAVERFDFQAQATAFRARLLEAAENADRA